MVRGTRSSLALLGSTVFLVAAKCCDYDCSPSEPEYRPPIAKVEILPEAVTVRNNTKFTMRSRVKDEWGNILLDWRADGVQWSTLGSVSVPPGPGASVVVDASVPTSMLPHWFQLIATIDGVADTVTIAILPDQQASGTKDWITADYSIGTTDPPTIALVNGDAVVPTADGTVSTLPPVAIKDSMIAFVRQAPLDVLECSAANCGELTIFKPGNAIVRDTAKWSPGCDFVVLVSGVSLPTGCSAPSLTVGVLEPLKPVPHIAVTVWKASSASDVDAKVDADVQFSRSVFNRPGTGFWLDFDVKDAGTTLPLVTFGVPCVNSDVAAQMPKPPVSFDRDRISVFYVDELSTSSYPTSETGLTCLHDPVTGPIIMISTWGLGTSTLAHELGHAIGGWINPSPQPFHTDVPVRLDGFEPSNVMWSSDPDTTRGIRVNFTLGQLFQMSYRDGSLIQHLRQPPYKSVDCYPVTGVSVCPALAKDVTR